MRDTFGDQVFSTIIRENTEFGKAIMVNKTIFQQELRASGAEDYAGLASEVVSRVVKAAKKRDLLEAQVATASEAPSAEVGVSE